MRGLPQPARQQCHGWGGAGLAPGSAGNQHRRPGRQSGHQRIPDLLPLPRRQQQHGGPAYVAPDRADQPAPGNGRGKSFLSSSDGSWCEYQRAEPAAALDDGERDEMRRLSQQQRRTRRRRHWTQRPARLELSHVAGAPGHHDRPYHRERGSLCAVLQMPQPDQIHHLNERRVALWHRRRTPEARGGAAHSLQRVPRSTRHQFHAR